RYRAADLGRLTGVSYAEGFNVERFPAIDSLFDLK
ncbi:MAG: bacillithiol biosynthesis deacetylase BshB1, partial [Flavobacteriaceae bacterium]